MTDDAIPLDETVRLLNTHLQRIVNSQPSCRIDRIAEMAERLFGVEMCLAVISGRVESKLTPVMIRVMKKPRLR